MKKAGSMFSRGCQAREVVDFAFCLPSKPARTKLLRGHSRSEDALDLSIKLTPHDEECDHLDCKLEYAKIRGQRRGVQSLSIRYKSVWEGWTWTFFEQDLVGTLRRLLEDDPNMSNISVSKVSIFKQAATGRIPSFRVGTCVRFDPRAVADWLRKM